MMPSSKATYFASVAKRLAPDYKSSQRSKDRGWLLRAGRTLPSVAQLNSLVPHFASQHLLLRATEKIVSKRSHYLLVSCPSSMRGLKCVTIHERDSIPRRWSGCTALSTQPGSQGSYQRSRPGARARDNGENHLRFGPPRLHKPQAPGDARRLSRQGLHRPALVRCLTTRTP